MSKATYATQVIVGKIGDVEVKETKNGKEIGYTTVSTLSKFGSKSVLNKFKCRLWGDTLKSVEEQCIDAGDRVLVIGTPRAEVGEYNGKESIRCYTFISQVEKLSGGAKPKPEPEPKKEPKRDYDDEELPDW